MMPILQAIHCSCLLFFTMVFAKGFEMVFAKGFDKVFVMVVVMVFAKVFVVVFISVVRTRGLGICGFVDL